MVINLILMIIPNSIKYSLYKDVKLIIKINRIISKIINLLCLKFIKNDLLELYLFVFYRDIRTIDSKIC